MNQCTSRQFYLYFHNMIKLIDQGQYSLIETKRQTKIISLGDKNVFAWVTAGRLGEILVASYNPHKADHVLALGRYRIYEVKDEPNITDLVHLELLVGDGKWQGYLLPTGLPNGKRRRRIVPTNEIITKSIVN